MNAFVYRLVYFQSIKALVYQSVFFCIGRSAPIRSSRYQCSSVSNVLHRYHHGSLILPTHQSTCSHACAPPKGIRSDSFFWGSNILNTLTGSFYLTHLCFVVSVASGLTPGRRRLLHSRNRESYKTLYNRTSKKAGMDSRPIKNVFIIKNLCAVAVSPWFHCLAVSPWFHWTFAYFVSFACTPLVLEGVAFFS